MKKIRNFEKTEKINHCHLKSQHFNWNHNYNYPFDHNRDKNVVGNENHCDHFPLFQIANFRCEFFFSLFAKIFSQLFF